MNKTCLCVAMLILGAAASSVAAGPLVTVALDTRHPGPPISADFEGLSFEVSLLLPGPNGVHYFRPDNRKLIRLFHTLGIESLRAGGNTSDHNVKRLPDRADLDSFFAFAKAAAVYFMSDGSRFATGQVLSVDGGWCVSEGQIP